MSELDVVAVITAKPGSEDVVREALTALVAPTLAEEGCVAYSLSVSVADPAVFVNTEKWRSQEDLDVHLASEHVSAAMAAAGEHLAGAPAVHPLRPVA